MDFTKVKPSLSELHKNKTTVMHDFHEAWNVKEFLKRRGFKTTFRHCSNGTYEINIVGQRFPSETLDSLWSKVLMEDLQNVMAEEAAKLQAAQAAAQTAAVAVSQATIQGGTVCPNPTSPQMPNLTPQSPPSVKTSEPVPSSNSVATNVKK